MKIALLLLILLPSKYIVLHKDFAVSMEGMESTVAPGSYFHSAKIPYMGDSVIVCSYESLVDFPAELDSIKNNTITE